MTQAEKDKIIKDLQEKLAEAEKIKVDEPKRWKPDKNMKYWHVNNKGFCSYMYYINDSCYDNWNYLTGNCFKTKKEAEYYKKKTEYTAHYKNYIEEHSEPIDWNNKKQPKYYAKFDYMDNSLETDFVYTCKVQGTIFASSGRIIEEAMKAIGVDNFMKYVLEVE